MSSAELTMSDHQRAELRFRARCNVLSAGGRNSGKTRNLCHAVIAHCEDFGDEARVVVTREERNALLQLMSLLYDLCVKVFGPGVQRNLNDMTLTLPNSAVIMLTNVADETSYARLQGMTFSMAAFEEIGNYSATAYQFAMRIRSNLRVRKGRRPSIWMTANPHGRSHTTLFRAFISKSAAWRPFVDEFGDTWVWTHSTVDQNPFVDAVNYKLQLAASVGNDKALAAAWSLGLWGALGGNLWDNFSAGHHIISALPQLPSRGCLWRVGCDWGVAAPAVALLGVLLPDNIPGYAPGSVIIADEFDTVADPSDLNVGTGISPDAFADEVITMCNRNGVTYIDGACDDARGLQGETVIELMRKSGLWLHKPQRKDRTGGWLLMRTMLESARTGDGPGLYVHAKCVNTIESIVSAPRDARRPSDVCHKFADHHLDAGRYLLSELAQPRKAVFGRAVGIV